MEERHTEEITSIEGGALRGTTAEKGRFWVLLPKGGRGVARGSLAKSGVAAVKSGNKASG